MMAKSLVREAVLKEVLVYAESFTQAAQITSCPGFSQVIFGHFTNSILSSIAWKYISVKLNILCDLTKEK
jgi:hypothetical protein